MHLQAGNSMFLPAWRLAINPKGWSTNTTRPPTSGRRTSRWRLRRIMSRWPNTMEKFTPSAASCFHSPVRRRGCLSIMHSSTIRPRIAGRLWRQCLRSAGLPLPQRPAANFTSLAERVCTLDRASLRYWAIVRTVRCQRSKNTIPLPTRGANEAQCRRRATTRRRVQWRQNIRDRWPRGLGIR